MHGSGIMAELGDEEKTSMPKPRMSFIFQIPGKLYQGGVVPGYHPCLQFIKPHFVMAHGPNKDNQINHERKVFQEREGCGSACSSRGPGIHRLIQTRRPRLRLGSHHMAFGTCLSAPGALWGAGMNPSCSDFPGGWPEDHPGGVTSAGGMGSARPLSGGDQGLAPVGGPKAWPGPEGGCPGGRGGALRPVVLKKDKGMRRTALGTLRGSSQGPSRLLLTNHIPSQYK